MEETKQTKNLNLTITSWNVRGIRKLIKLKQVLNRVKYLKSQIVFIQETHLTKTDIHKLNRKWQGQIFHAPFTSQARGVTILIHKSVPFQKSKLMIDTGGRYIIVQGTILLQKVNLINVYGPNDGSPTFFENLLLNVSALEGPYIVGGDFNCTLNPILQILTERCFTWQD